MFKIEMNPEMFQEALEKLRLANIGLQRCRCIVIPINTGKVKDTGELGESISIEAVPPVKRTEDRTDSTY